jgi:hypothetical protein
VNSEDARSECAGYGVPQGKRELQYLVPLRHERTASLGRATAGLVRR